MTGNVRATASAILNEVQSKLPISSRRNPNDFTKYTGYTQAKLEALWAGGSKLTCCNEFVNWYSKELATRLRRPVLPLGNFSTEGWLAANGKHHAWVQAREGVRPFQGDIYRPRSFHMGIVYSCEDPGEFISIDGGQGGPRMGEDKISELKRPFVVANFLGWVDIQTLFAASPVHPVPPWLPGWWEVTIQSRKSWYWFAADYTVIRTNVKPQNAHQRPQLGQKTRFSIEFGNIFVLSWPKTGGHYEVEKFTNRPFAGHNIMDGDRDGLLDLTATRVFS